MSDSIKISLIVQEADRSEAGSGYARINNDVMAKIGVEPGDFVKITGKRIGAAKVMRSSVSGSGGIAIYGYTRDTTGVGIGDTVIVEKVIPKTAAKITLQPISQRKRLDSRALEQTILKYYAGRPITKGQILTFEFRTKDEDPVYSNWRGFSNYSTEQIDFAVSEVSPGDVAIIGSETNVNYKDGVYKREDASKGKSAGSLHYEDIGGLGRELTLVREMIEYPSGIPRSLRSSGSSRQKEFSSMVRRVQERP